MGSTALFAYLSYRDAARAIEWLTALGFQIITRQNGGDGQVIHSELRLDDAVIMVSSFDADYETPALKGRSVGRGLYLRVDDVDGFNRRAVDAGGRAVIEPESTEWGGRRARVLDPEGNEWSFGTYEPGTR